MAKAFSNLNEPLQGSAVIFDALNLAFRWKHKGDKIFAESYVETVKSFLRSYGNNLAIITADGGSSSYRKAIYPEYKADRAEKYANQTEEEAQAFQDFIDEYVRAVDLLREEGFIVLKFDKVEADDIAAHLVNNKRKYGIEEQIWLISTDGDWDLLVEPGVSRFAYGSRKETTVNNWYERYSVSPEMLLTYKCLRAKEDNIVGPAGVGPVRASQIIEQYGDIFDICDALPIDSKYAYIKNLNEFGKERLLLNAQLMDLRTYCDEAIGLENILEMENILSGN